ncbi:hypothetical protein D3Z38_15375 [Clostridiales bacterium]|nr:hypothetical protein [Clostridiales bacterium]
MKSGFKAEKLAFEPAFWIFAVKPDEFKWKKSSHNTARLEDSPGLKLENRRLNPLFLASAARCGGFILKKSGFCTAQFENSPGSKAKNPGLNPPLAADLAVLNHKNTDLNPLDISPTLIKAVFIASRILIVVLVEIRGIMNATNQYGVAARARSLNHGYYLYL